MTIVSQENREYSFLFASVIYLRKRAENAHPTCSELNVPESDRLMFVKNVVLTVDVFSLLFDNCNLVENT